MRFRLLGPLEVRAGDDWQGIGAPKWRSVLAVLLIKAGQIVPADVLISEVWGDAPPAKATNLISIYVLRLRRLLGDADSTLLVTRAPGYQLRIGAEDSDAQVFEAMVHEGRRALAAGDAQSAAARLAEALALWHGSPLADVPPTPWSRPRPNGWTNSASTPPSCGSGPSWPAAATPRSSVSCAGCWPATRSGKACGCC